MQPRWQQCVGIDANAFVEADAVLAEQTLQAAVLEHFESIRAAADELAGDEDLRDGLTAGSGAEQGADLSAAVVALVGGRVQIDGSIRDRAFGEQFA